MKSNNFSSGQSLFEVILALALATLIVVALVALASNSIRNVTFSKNKTLSTRYAQEATEWLRGQRDEDWDTFRANVSFCPTPPHIQCLNTLSWEDCGVCGDTEFKDKIFKREISFPEVSDNSISIEVKVYWTDAQGLHEVRSSTILTDWKSQY